MPSFDPAREWKHQTTKDSRRHGDPVGVDLFDDEQEGMTTIYVRHADGTRYPARDVFMGKPEHAKSVLEAWQTRGPTNDYRTKYKGLYVLESAK